MGNAQILIPMLCQDGFVKENVVRTIPRFLACSLKFEKLQKIN